MINDQIIKEYYTNKIIHSWNKIPEEHKEYLKNRFTDSESYKESVWRILYNIEKRPVCPICGNKVHFFGRKDNIFSKTCSNKCFKEILTKEKTEEELYYQSLSSAEKTKYTCIKKYGVNHPSKLETNIFKSNNPQKNSKIKEKTKQTRINKYGQYMSPNNIKALLSKDIKEKRINSFNKTLLETYGNINYRNLNKYKQTCLKKYNVDHYSKTKEFKDNIKRKSIEINIKINNTKKKNNSYNKSKPEDECYELLKSKYIDVKRQYYSEVYPFNCDFYIPSLDLYIEYNGLWTHGFHPYNQDNIEDQNKLKEWKAKNTEFYDNAIKVWTISDIKKREIAKQNNLNFIEFWNLKEVEKWLNQNTK